MQKIVNGKVFDVVLLADPATGDEVSPSGPSDGSSTTRTYTYTAQQAWTGVAGGDTVVNTVVKSSDGAVVSSYWTGNGGVDVSAPPVEDTTYIIAKASNPATDGAIAEVRDAARAIETAVKAQAGGASVQDADGNLFVMVYNLDEDPVVVTYYEYGTTTIGTPTMPVAPFEFTAGTVTANAGANLNTSALALDETLTDGSQQTSVVSTERTPSWARETEDGAVDAGAYSVSFTSISGAITVGGVSLNAGESVSFTAPLGDTLSAIDYTVTSGELIIAKVA